MFTAYIDDSGSEESHLVTLGGVAGWDERLETLDKMWQETIDAKNTQLKSEGRPEISHYHATDCSNLVREYEGWSVSEQVDFFKKLLEGLRLHYLLIVGISVDTRDLGEVFPEARNKLDQLAFVILLREVMLYLSEKILGDDRWPDDQMVIVHEQGPYDATLDRAFATFRKSSKLPFGERFAAMRRDSKNCPLLQAADLVAYENYKAAEREVEGNARRKSFAAIVGFDSIAGRGSKILKQGLQEIRGAMSAEEVTALLRDAGLNLSN